MAMSSKVLNAYAPVNYKYQKLSYIKRPWNNVSFKIKKKKKEGDNSPSAHKNLGALISAGSQADLSLIATVLHCHTLERAVK